MTFYFAKKHICKKSNHIEFKVNILSNQPHTSEGYIYIFKLLAKEENKINNKTQKKRNKEKKDFRYSLFHQKPSHFFCFFFYHFLFTSIL